jgi:two-component sensor histidine kinase
MGMALHELATNALKYGAWTGAGSVTVEVRVEPETPSVRIVWSEHGGPRVQTPETRGFGSRLLERGVAAELGGTVELDFKPEGLVCTIFTTDTARITPLP